MTDHSSAFVPQYEPQEALLRDFCSKNPIPPTAGLPALPDPWPLTAPVMAWKAQDLQGRYITHLTDAERGEIVSACAAYTGKLFPVSLL